MKLRAIKRKTQKRFVQAMQNVGRPSVFVVTHVIGHGDMKHGDKFTIEGISHRWKK